MRDKLLHNPQFPGVLAATEATVLGVLVMAAAGAPKAYLIINMAALTIGVSLLALVQRNRTNATYAGWLGLAAAAGLLATALLGTTIDGATRWVRIGAVSLQPSLVLLPLLIMAFAWSRDAAMTVAMLVTAVALAIQPDRAMAGALVAGLAALALTVRDRQVLLVLVAALCSLAVTLVRPDTLPPTPFVEQVYAGAFGFSTVAGLALLAGSALLLPMRALHRTGATVFAAVWLALLAAAVIGNYPTPLLGYGGSGILGYLLCLAGLPRPARRQAAWWAASAKPRRFSTCAPNMASGPKSN
jgi:cell division protein FtsW (lipid II flippase)